MKKKLLLVPLVFTLVFFLYKGRQDICFAKPTSACDIKLTGQINSHYIWYTPDALKEAESHGRAVLYFWAPWCSTCRIADDELKGKDSELPSDVTVVKVDFDKETELRTKYAVTTQHTFIQVDKNGEPLSLWVGGDVNTLKENLK